MADIDRSDHRSLRLTAEPWRAYREVARERIGSPSDTGTTTERVIAFENAGAIRRLMTPKRLELIRSVMAMPPASMRELADRLDRSPSEVHHDVHLLTDSGILEIVTAGRSKQPIAPFETVTFEVRLELPSDPDEPSRESKGVDPSESFPPKRSL